SSRVGRLDSSIRPGRCSLRARSVHRTATAIHALRSADWCALARRRVRFRVSRSRRHEHQIGAPPSRWDESLDYPRLMPSLMAFFKRKEKVPAEVERLDWKLLERGAVALYHKGSVLSQDLAWFRQQKYVVHELDAAQWKEPANFHDAVRG